MEERLSSARSSSRPVVRCETYPVPEEGKKVLLPINTTFTVLKVFDVNEDESFIDILFKLKLLKFSLQIPEIFRD